MNISAVSFDLDDTLWDNRPVIHSAEQRGFDWLLQHYPRIGEFHTQESFRELRLELARRIPELACDLTRLRKVGLQRLAQQAGYDDALIEPAFEVFFQARHQVTLYPDVLPALKTLRDAGFLIGALTNGNADINRLGIAHLFDFSLSAAEAKTRKPDPTFFIQACKKSNLIPEELVHVGDDLKTDICGAKSAGIHAIWLNREMAPNPAGHSFDLVAYTLHEVVDRLDYLKGLSHRL